MTTVLIPSGFIASVGYCPNTLRCEVVFRESGEKYGYSSVTPSDAAKLTYLSGNELGKFFNGEFKARYRGFEIVSVKPR